MDLFDFMRNENMEKDSPLASRLRPTTLDEVVGQEHIIGKDKLLYRAIKADKLSSIIFYTAWDWENNIGKSNCEYNKCRIYSDKCYCCRQERYGRSSGKG